MENEIAQIIKMFKETSSFLYPASLNAVYVEAWIGFIFAGILGIGATALFLLSIQSIDSETELFIFGITASIFAIVSLTLSIYRYFAAEYIAAEQIIKMVR